MESTNYHKNKSAGHLEVVVPTMDGDTRENALPASAGPRGRSINTYEFLGLEHTWGPSSKPVCGNPARERVQLGVPHSVSERPNYKSKKTSNKQALLIASLNIRDKQYSNKKFKYKDLIMLIRQKGIAIMALQETKLSEKDTETMEKENPRLAIESNPNDRRARTAFAINKDIIK